MPWKRAELAYCSNVHPGSDLPAVEANIAGAIAGVRQRRGLEQMGCGLWLPANAARTLVGEPGRLARLLDQHGLFVFTLNGFPYGDFHGARVKEAVYSPAWDSEARLAYTLDLARILAHCLPEDCAEGSISSLPLGFARDWDERRQDQALGHLCILAAELDRIASQSGRSVRVCLEPEPGCVLETTGQVIDLFTRALPAAAARIGVSREALNRHLGVCLDVCHQAVMFEEPADCYERLVRSGVVVGKIQISSALTVPDPSKAHAMRALAPFAEPRYLHQVRCLRDGRLTGVMDLAEAIEGPQALPRDTPWRVHFHVPLQTESVGSAPLATTQTAIARLLALLAAAPEQHPHLEVETYTWEVLPPDRRPTSSAELEAGLARELEWLEEQMAARGMLG